MNPNPSSQAPTTSNMSRQTGQNRAGSDNEQSFTEFEGFGDSVNSEQVKELLCEALETEIGGVKIYETAIRCAENEELKEEWEKYLEETQNHERILRDVFEKLQLDPDTQTPGRGIVRAHGEALCQSMEMALEANNPQLAQIVAAECVVLAETKDHLNWELIGEVCNSLEGEAQSALQEAYDEVEEQEDEHLYHTRGWARELWLEACGVEAVLPPPEEKRDVRSMAEAAQAKKTRTSMIQGKSGGRGMTGSSKGGRSTRSKGGNTNTKTKAKNKTTKGRGRSR